jgi:intein-encoded DNA endonuclease-like protein
MNRPAKSRITAQRVEAYKKAFELRKQGLGPIRISKIIGVPWPTIGHWFYEGYHPLGATNRFEVVASPELAYVIGAVLGDGYVHYKSGQEYEAVLCVKDREFAETFSKSVTKILRKQKPYKVQRVNGRYYRVEAHSFELYQFLTKPIEELKPYVEAYPNHFLRGLYDAEGSVSVDQHGYRIRLSNTNPNIIQLAKEMLERMGFKVHVSYNPEHYGEYTLNITGKEQIRRFAREIGFSIPRKQSRLEVD